MKIKVKFWGWDGCLYRYVDADDMDIPEIITKEFREDLISDTIMEIIDLSEDGHQHVTVEIEE